MRHEVYPSSTRERTQAVHQILDLHSSIRDWRVSPPERARPPADPQQDQRGGYQHLLIRYCLAY